jgi:DNA-binding NarL/FixJ family response regulator
MTPRAHILKKLDPSRDIDGLAVRDSDPVQDGPCPQPLPGHAVTGDRIMRQASVIFADKNILLRKFLRMSIQEDPHLLIAKEADDGLELLRQLEENPPDIIVLDISLPSLSGLEVAKIVKEKNPQIKIVILTMYDRKSYFRYAWEIGVDGYVLKDEIEKIHAIITTILQGKTYVSSCFQ